MSQDFAQLVDSRRQWIEEILKPWCATARRRDLLLAELEWQDLAGRPAPERTLWVWAWGRFPALVDTHLNAMNETLPLRVRRRDGDVCVGYPDARESQRGNLVLLSENGRQLGPFSIDDIVEIRRVGEPAGVRETNSGESPAD